MTDSSPYPERRHTSANILLQAPRKWTAEHVKLAKVEVTENVDSQTMTLGYILGDDDSEFNKLAEALCQPSRDDLETRNYEDTLEVMFPHVFDDLTQAHEALQDGPGSTFYLYSSSLFNLVRPILISMRETSSKLLYSQRPVFPVRIPQLSSKTTLRSYKMITKRVKERSWSVPLMTPSAVNPDYDAETQMTRHEIPHCLLRAMLAYSQNPNLQEYMGFALCLRGTSIQISKATVPQTYLKNFVQKGEITESMQLSRSEPLDLMERDGRREFLRLIMGVFRYLMQAEQSDIILPE